MVLESVPPKSAERTTSLGSYSHGIAKGNGEGKIMANEKGRSGGWSEGCDGVLEAGWEVVPSFRRERTAHIS